MVTSEEIIKKIREIIKKHHNYFILNVLGNSVFTKEELKKLKDLSLDVNKNDSFLELVYIHNFINKNGSSNNPTSVEDMKNQQNNSNTKPIGEVHDFTIEDLNNNTKQLIEKMSQEVITRIEGIIRENGRIYKNNALQNLDRSELNDTLVKESSLGRVKQKLRDLSGDETRNWNRIAMTEMSNAIGAGSADRIVSENQDKDLGEVYVYKVIVGDAKTCKFCRRFYQDNRDNAPKLYRLSTLLANGSNMNRKSDSWVPVIGATHPNTRTSASIELKPGWKLQAGGRVTYIGMKDWEEYIRWKLEK